MPIELETGLGILDIIHFAAFKLMEYPNRHSVSERQLKALAAHLREAMIEQGFAVGYTFGSANDIWGFTVEINKVEILVGLYPPGDKVEDSWNVQVMLRYVALLKKTGLRNFEP